jgi:hypothetical protein
MACHCYRCTRCYFPAAACIASLIFSTVVGILIWRASLYMIRRVINRTLQQRLKAFLGLFVSGKRSLHFPSETCALCLVMAVTLGRMRKAPADVIAYICWTGWSSGGSAQMAFLCEEGHPRVSLMYLL